MLMDISMGIDLKDKSLWENADEDLMEIMKDGHLGTHIDVRNKVFDISNCVLKGRVFNVTHVKDHEIERGDIFGIDKITQNDFVILNTGWSEKERYGSNRYFNDHPEISMDLLAVFISKGVSLVGIDAPGLKRGELHGKVDQYLADHGIFVVENLTHLDQIEGEVFQAFCFPIRLENTSGIPCRVLIETLPVTV